MCPFESIWTYIVHTTLIMGCKFLDSDSVLHQAERVQSMTKKATKTMEEMRWQERLNLRAKRWESETNREEREVDQRERGLTGNDPIRAKYFPIKMQFYISLMFLGLPDDIQEEKPSFFNFENNWLPTDRPTDRPTDGRTDPLIEMRGRI